MIELKEQFKRSLEQISYFANFMEILNFKFILRSF